MNETLAQMGFSQVGDRWVLSHNNKALTVIPQTSTIIISYAEQFANIDIRYSNIPNKESFIAIINETLRFQTILEESHPTDLDGLAS